MKNIYPGDVILFKGGSFVSRGIRFFTKSNWNHAAMALDGTYLMEATLAGVEKNRIEPLLKKSKEFCVLRHPELSITESELIKSKAYSLFYTGYDVVQLLSMAPYFIFRALGLNLNFLIFNSRDKMICSELCAVCYAAAGYKIAKSLKSVAPSTLYSSPVFDIIFEGKYSDFAK